MRYIGSKRRIADEILPIMLDNDINTFVDAFCGGCSVIERVPFTYMRIANGSRPQNRCGVLSEQRCSRGGGSGKNNVGGRRITC